MREVERIQAAITERYGPGAYLRIEGDGALVDRVLIAKETEEGYRPFWRGTVGDLYQTFLSIVEPDEVTAAKLRLYSLLLKTKGLSTEDLELGLQLAGDPSVRQLLHQKETPR